MYANATSTRLMTTNALISADPPGLVHADVRVACVTQPFRLDDLDVAAERRGVLLGARATCPGGEARGRSRRAQRDRGAVRADDGPRRRSRSRAPSASRGGELDLAARAAGTAARARARPPGRRRAAGSVTAAGRPAARRSGAPRLGRRQRSQRLPWRGGSARLLADLAEGDAAVAGARELLEDARRRSGESSTPKRSAELRDPRRARPAPAGSRRAAGAAGGPRG